MQSRRLNSLSIEGFRAFKSLRIERFADVNLIVGKNNSGKTTLLEALRLYFLQGDRYRITELLLSREEYSFQKQGNLSESGLPPLAYEALFYGRPKFLETKPSFRIGPLAPNADNAVLDVDFTWLREVREEDGTIRFFIANSDIDADTSEIVPGLEIRFSEHRSLVSLARLNRLPLGRRNQLSDALPSIVFLPSTGFSPVEVGQLWDLVTLTEEEQEVICGLRLISSSIEKLVLVQGPGPRSNERIMMVKLAEFRDAIPFKSLGAGMNHLLGVFLALTKARESVLLIDELENGVHYSVQPVLWDLIFKQAANLNIQVFVTTHSWDCVEGFQIAANKQSDTSAVVVRLEEHKGSVKGVLFSSQEIEIARRENIEVR